MRAINKEFSLFNFKIKFMKTKTFLIIVITLFLLTGITGLDRNNDDYICAFNVDDPINDLQWLKKRIPTTSPDDSFSYYLNQNKEKSNKYFFIEVYVDNGVTKYTRKTIYICKGDKLMMKGIESSTPSGRDKFQGLNLHWIPIHSEFNSNRKG